MKNEIIVPIFNDDYKAIVCWGEPKDIERVLKKWHYPSIDVASSMLSKRGVCFYNNECHPVIALPSKPVCPVEIGTLAHEAVHAVVDIFQRIGDTGIDDEVFAHSVGAIVRKVMAS